MARLSDRKTLSNEEIEASVEELSRKLEILRVRYEQYFIGVEKVAPSVMRMEVVRSWRRLWLAFGSIDCRLTFAPHFASKPTVEHSLF